MTNKDNGGPASDRELLEMAAKAAGFNGLGSWDEKLGYMWDGEGWSFDPLTDDGDALRLAVGLDLLNSPRVAHEISVERLTKNADKLTATRRAIVRAAAAIGSAM